jgi:hypothetical protein
MAALHGLNPEIEIQRPHTRIDSYAGGFVNFCLRGVDRLGQTASGFNLDRDAIVQGANDRDSKFRVHFGEPLRVQGLKLTFS